MPVNIVLNSVSLSEVEGHSDNRLGNITGWWGDTVAECNGSQHIVLTFGVLKNI